MGILGFKEFAVGVVHHQIPLKNFKKTLLYPHTFQRTLRQSRQPLHLRLVKLLQQQTDLHPFGKPPVEEIALVGSHEELSGLFVPHFESAVDELFALLPVVAFGTEALMPEVVGYSVLPYPGECRVEFVPLDTQYLFEAYLEAVALEMSDTDLVVVSGGIEYLELLIPKRRELRFILCRQ